MTGAGAMTGFDYVVLLVLGVTAAGGFFRGFVQEALSLAGLVIAAMAVRLLHAPLTEILSLKLVGGIGAGLLAFALLSIVPWFVVRLVAARMGGAARNSVLGPADRALGFGFGAAKGAMICVLAYSAVVFGSDVIWGAGGRPTWLTKARIYPVIDTASEDLMTVLAERRAKALKKRPATEDQAEAP